MQRTTQSQSRTTDSRVFFAVWPDAAAAQALHDLASENRKLCGGRVMRCDTLHLTLVFLGDIPADRLAEAMAVASGIAAAPFALTLDRLGYWRHNRILWAGGESEPLAGLADRLSTGLKMAGFRLDARPFVAHLTLLRDTQCAEAPILPKPVVWPVNEFLLVESRLSAAGARYEAIGRWPLLG
jgi:RNA 2',3'-cyclic 3'-phosphodiesterase